MKKTKRELLVLAAATTVALLMGVTVQAKGDEKVLTSDVRCTQMDV